MNMKLIKTDDHFPRHIDVISRNIDHAHDDDEELSTDSSDSSDSPTTLLQRPTRKMNIRFSASTSPSPNLHPTSYEYYLEQKYNNFDPQTPKLKKKYKKSKTSSNQNNIYESFSPVAMDIEMTSSSNSKKSNIKPRLTR